MFAIMQMHQNMFLNALICYKAVHIYPFVLQFVPECFTPQEMCSVKSCRYLPFCISF